MLRKWWYIHQRNIRFWTLWKYTYNRVDFPFVRVRKTRYTIWSQFWGGNDRERTKKHTQILTVVLSNFMFFPDLPVHISMKKTQKQNRETKKEKNSHWLFKYYFVLFMITDWSDSISNRQAGLLMIKGRTFCKGLTF